MSKEDKEDKEIALIKERSTALLTSPVFSDSGKLEALLAKSKEVLEAQMQDGKPMAEDPELALEAFKAIAKATTDVLEAKRRALDTLIKARALFSEKPSVVPSNSVDPLGDTPDQSTASNSSFGKVAADTDEA